MRQRPHQLPAGIAAHSETRIDPEPPAHATPARMSRRHVIELFGALGLAAAVAPLAGGVVRAQSTPGASLEPGPQPDGTNLWRVQVGGMDMASATDFHAFFPGEITINAGDSVEFAFFPMGMPGAHTVTFTSGGDLPPLFVPESGGSATPAAGPPRLEFNPAVVWPDGRTEYDGTGMINSGIDLLRTEDLGPYVLTFTTPGTFTYVCALHAIVMEGTVTVQEAGSELPMDQAGYDALAAEEMAAVLETGLAAIEEAEAMVAPPAAEGPSTWDVAAGVGGLSQARVMRFIPAELTIKVGDTVRWTNDSEGEPHTVTFLGGTEQPEDLILEPQGDGPPKLIQNMATLTPSGGPDFDGEGYANSGFMWSETAVNEALGLVGSVWELTFTAAGDFPYYCILHSGGPEAEGGMNGRIIVEE
jgi:plastocyanin